MLKNKTVWIAVGMAVVALAAGWWFLGVPLMKIALENQTNTIKTSMNESSNNPQGVEGYAIYNNVEFHISFSHPVGWYCMTYRGVADRPTWNQTICDNETDGTYKGDPLVVVDTPLESSPMAGGDDVKVSQTSIIGQNSSSIKVTVYDSYLFPGSGAVEYIFEGSSTAKSFAMEGGYGKGKPYATAEDVRKTLDPIAQSVVIK